MSTALAPLLVVIGVLYLLILPFVANAAVMVRQRAHMRKENHPESAIDRATSGILPDFIEAMPPWRAAVMVRPLAMICAVFGPLLLVLSLIASAVFLLVVGGFLLFCSTIDDLKTLSSKGSLASQR